MPVWLVAVSWAKCGVTKVSRAKYGFELFFKNHPKTKNPTDINSREKLAFFVNNGFDLLFEMQAARKQNTEKNGKPNPWTKQEYWSE